MNKTEIEKFVHQHLIDDGFEQNEFGVISAEFANGGGTMNLTLVIASAIEAYLDN